MCTYLETQTKGEDTKHTCLETKKGGVNIAYTSVEIWTEGRFVNTYIYIYILEMQHKGVDTKPILVSGFHHALWQSTNFISRLMHSNIRNLEVKIYVV